MQHRSMSDVSDQPTSILRANSALRCFARQTSTTQASLKIRECDLAQLRLAESCVVITRRVPALQEVYGRCDGINKYRDCRGMHLH